MSEAFCVLLQATVLPDGALSYADVIGNVYMEFLGKYRPYGQFFTPQAVADMMAQMVMSTYEIEQEFQRRLAAVCESDPVLQALSWTCAMSAQADGLAEAAQEWFLAKVLPAAMPKVEPLRVLDPCVGSGVMLLAAAKATPRWLIDIGFVQFFGIDIDPLCVQLARLNMRLYGLKPVLKAADLLTLQEAAALPWPHDKLYGGLIEAQQAEDESKVELYREGVELARAQQLEMWAGLPLILDESRKSPLRPQAGRSTARRAAHRDGREPDHQLAIALAETTEQVA
jgi:SAM-dependent methyltransferase